MYIYNVYMYIVYIHNIQAPCLFSFLSFAVTVNLWC